MVQPKCVFSHDLPRMKELKRGESEKEKFGKNNVTLTWNIIMLHALLCSKTIRCMLYYSTDCTVCNEYDILMINIYTEWESRINLIKE